MIFTPFAFMASQVAPAPGFLLDTYSGATIAYSLRKLSSSSTNAVEVRRSSDNALLDVGFVGEDLDTASLLSWAGTDTVYVRRWYDQSGNNNHAIMTATLAQPIIAESSAMQVVNSKSAISFNGTSQYLNLGSSVATSNTTAWSWVFNRASTGIKQMNLATGASSVPYGPYWFSDNNWYYAPNTSAGSSGLANSGTGQYHFFGNAPGTGNITYNLNASSIGTRGYSFVSTNYTVFGRRSADYFNGKQQEFILWDSDESSNQTGIESNINTYYSIYP